MKSKLWNLLKNEIVIEYKACLYFSCLISFYCVYLLCRGVYSVSILSLCEMILMAYFVGYLQIYVLHDFDEAEKFGKREATSAFLCTCIYAGVSGVLGWFEGNVWVTVLFSGYIFLCYLCVYLINKIRRKVDTDRLNDMLTAYKKEGEASRDDGVKE